ncbi:MAG: hypothetical protein ACRD8W_29080 [Nitrososphaeraceae archaeon]
MIPDTPIAALPNGTLRGNVSARAARAMKAAKPHGLGTDPRTDGNRLAWDRRRTEHRATVNSLSLLCPCCSSMMLSQKGPRNFTSA